MDQFPSWLSGIFGSQGGAPSFGPSAGSWAPQMQQPSAMPPAMSPQQPPGFSILGGNSNMQQNARNAMLQKAMGLLQPQMKTPGWMPPMQLRGS